jgi:transcriptional regulator with XRE-family HTH domain
LDTNHASQEIACQRAILSFYLAYNCMKSRRKTTVAVLRHVLGLSVEEFAKLIGKSATTVNSLESGRLKLSEETAFKIQQETDIDLQWLLKAKPKEKPYASWLRGDGTRQPYTKEQFELTQSTKGSKSYLSIDPEYYLIGALSVVGDWISVYTAAERSGRSDLAIYLMCQFLDQLVERMGKDSAAAAAINKGARILVRGEKWIFIQDKETGELVLKPESEVVKS